MFSIDPFSPLPPFEQVRTHFAEAARTGELAVGTRLPTVRRLAEELGLAPNTVAKAYRELEQVGILETRGRNGTFIAAQGSDRAQEAVAAATTYVQRLRELGIPADEAVRLVQEALAPGVAL